MYRENTVCEIKYEVSGMVVTGRRKPVRGKRRDYTKESNVEMFSPHVCDM